MKKMICLALLGLVATGLWGAEPYHWPMQAERALTSSFAEYRGGRLHAAIDLKTWGKEGFPILAVADGYVVRVRTSPWGYGRAVYVMLADGRTGVWAHLSGFSDRIATYVHAEQDRRGTYSVNMFFRPDQLPVKRGEVLGFSGSTGIGVPHLHFELRDANQRPINPLTHGFEVADTLPPDMKAVGVVPKEAHARIQGDATPKVFALRYLEKQKYYVMADTLTIWGQVGLALDVYDRADASALTNRMAPYQLRLMVDDRDVFVATYDLFGYDVNNHGELDRNFMLSQRGLGRLQNLYREVGNQLPFYGIYRPGDGVLWAGGTLKAGVHNLRIIAKDANGNQSEARLVVKVAPAPVFVDFKTTWLDQAVTVSATVRDGQRAIFERSVNGGKTWQAVGDWVAVGEQEIAQTLPRVTGTIYRIVAQNAQGLSAFRTFAQPTKDEMRLTWTVDYFPTWAVARLTLNRISSDGAEVHLRDQAMMLRQIDLLTYEVVVPFDVSRQGDVRVMGQADGVIQDLMLTQQVVTKQGGGAIGTPDGAVQVRFDVGDVYDTFVGRARVDSSLVDAHLIGSAFELMPNDVAFETATLAFAYPQETALVRQLGIYERRGTRWVFVDHGRDEAKHLITGDVKHLGTYALMVDDAPPEIVRVVPEKKQVVAETQPEITVVVRDAMSGIWREEDYAILLDGTRLIVEYDPEEDRMVAQPRQALSSGTHQLVIRVRDICGNETQQTHDFVVK